MSKNGCSVSFKASGVRTERIREFDRALESVGSSIRDPVLKLQFLRESMAYYETLRRRVDWLPSAILRRAVYRWLSLERFRVFARSRGMPRHVRARLHRSLITGRLTAVLALSAAICCVAAVTFGILMSIHDTSARISPASPSATSVATSPPASDYPSEGITSPPPQAVWLVEHGAGWEQYSNGLRIDTRYSVSGDKRRFRAFSENGMSEEVFHTPVGILFHTSESDIWPLEVSYNERLRDSSTRLLRYIRRRKLYNYVIDRFGRTFRIVEEDCKANHAGFSIWGDYTRYYLNLNHPFIGICLESRWEGGITLPITTAQLNATRSLTECLRFRYGIASEMCVGHGMTSVNPSRHLIGHHLDWARGFPFSELGLPDHYRIPPPSVSVFGFDYDDHFLAVMREPWAGVKTAERILEGEASRRGVSIDEIKKEKQTLYDILLSQLTRDDEAASRPEKRAASGDPRGG